MSSLFHQINFELLSHSNGNRIEEELQVLENEIEEIINPEHLTPTIENGHLLPSPLRRNIRPQLSGVALKEVSTKYKNNDTFVVIGRGSRILYRFGQASLYSKSNEGGWRGQAIAILTHGIFNYFMVVAILLNCILFATIPYEPTAPSSTTVQEDRGIDGLPGSKPQSDYGIIGKINSYGFLILYILEFALKIAARGFWGKRNPFSCLRISWSWLDMFVIIVGLLSVAVPSNRTLAALNGFRALKLIPLIPSWLGGYDQMFRRTWKRLFRVAIFAAIVSFLLSLMACEMFFNTLRQKCALNSSAVASYASGVPLKEESFLLNPRGEAYYLPCGNSSVSEVCPANYVCLIVGDNPQGGHVAFDSLPRSEFTLLNILFQDYAEFVYEEIWAIHGPFHIIYFIIVFFLGTFSIGTLVYALLGYEFEKGYVQTLAADEDGTERVQNRRGSTDFEQVFHVRDANILEKIKENGRKLVKHDYFDFGITLFVLLDMVNYGLDHYGIEQNKPLWTFFHLTNQVVYVVYCLEFILKVTFLGVKTYWKKPWNRFDFFVVILIVVQSILEGGLMSYRITTSVLKLVPRWPALNLVLTIMIKTTWVWFRWAFGLNGVILFVFAYIGYVAFGNSYRENFDVFPHSEIPRWNLVDFWHSIRLMFRSFSGEWIETTWDLLLVSPGPGAMLLMVSSGIIGNFLVTCLGVGIILTTSAHLSQSEAASEETERKQTSLQRIFSPCALFCSKVASWTAAPDENELNPGAVQNGEPASKPPVEDGGGGDEEKATNDDAEVEPSGERVEGKGQKLRSGVTKILDHHAYRAISSLLIILVSILVMYYEFPTEIFFVIYFTIEGLLRLIGIGSGWRKLLNVGLIFDAVMILNSIFALGWQWRLGIGQFGSFRLFMLVGRIPGLAIVRDQLWAELRSLSQYILATLFIWFAFALGGMSLFSGKFAKCVSHGVAIDPVNIPGKADCIAANESWEEDQPYSFDSVPASFLTLLTVATRNGWIHSITSAEDVNGRDLQPGRDASPAAILYFVAFLLIGVLFPLYIMFGVLWTSFKKRSWIALFRKNSKPAEGGSEGSKSQPANPDSSFLSKYVNNDYFEFCVCLTILVDSIAVAIQFSTDEDVDPAGFEGLWILRICILVVYVAELVLRGITLKGAFFKRWLNDLLLLVIVVSIVEFFVDDLGDAVNYFLILRTFRLFHILSLDKVGSCGLPEFTSFRKALSSSFSPGSYLLIFYAIVYSTFAIFGSVAFEGLVDFSSWKSMTTLFKVATLSGWDGIYERISVGGECKVDSGGDCGQSTLGLFYVTTFIFLTVLSFVNLYFVVVMEIVNQLRNCEEAVFAETGKCKRGLRSNKEAQTSEDAVEQN